ncbi:hypothetical protein GQ53DRAFT_832941 [Thozetella sp. PMI_491]|nr:hypothetical protein GQ53DRAFT_832941 [Thozetella sp. PMI_491]
MAGSDKPSDESQTRPDQFQPFPRLPAELRREIWSFAASSPTSVSSVCIFTSDMASRKKPMIVHEPTNAVLLETTREAHHVASETSTTRAYNPDRDVLYISKEMFQRFTTSASAQRGPSWVPRIRHLALAIAGSDQGLWLPIALRQMDSLESISIVYPAVSGTVDCFADVGIPSRKGASLRLMTEEERERLIVSADYVYGTWAGDFNIRWTRNVNEHLVKVIENMNRESGPGMPGGAAPMWDPETKQLRLRFEARVFEPLE